tara:strand:+ start:957 stop:1292 length:336 start_codon:yes stop_codon:yes gene_type:complete
MSSIEIVAVTKVAKEEETAEEALESARHWLTQHVDVAGVTEAADATVPTTSRQSISHALPDARQKARNDARHKALDANYRKLEVTKKLLPVLLLLVLLYLLLLLLLPFLRV